MVRAKPIAADNHYTPHLLAQTLIDSASTLRPSVVADLCAGRGDLLLQAETVWPSARYAAVDIDPTLVHFLRRRRPNWHVGECDITSPISRKRSSVLKLFDKNISLLLLNPPFTCRGNTRHPTPTHRGTIYAGTAMSFLITATSYLHANGTAIAILPSGAFHNQKDQLALNYIKTRFDVTVVHTPSPRSFPTSSVATVIAHLTPRRGLETKLLLLPVHESPRQRLSVGIVRGCIPLYRCQSLSSGPAFVHSTDLQDSTVHLNGKYAIHPTRIISGPAVLIPRVGQLTPRKIALFKANTPIVLSDCVIALTTRTFADAKHVRNRLLTEFPLLRGQYVGSGAPFISLQRLRTALDHLGINVHDE